MKIQKLLAEICVYCVGLFILALGVAFAINSDLGISPVSSWAIAVHLVSGIGAGFSMTLFFIGCILFQIVLLRKAFKWVNLTQIVFSFLFGFFVDAAIWIVGDFGIPTYIGQLVMLSISMILIAIGLSVYLEAKLVSLPSEGVILAIIQKYPKFSFHRVKIIMDCLLVAMAMGTTLIFMGGIYGVREGTVIAAVAIGKIIPFVRKIVVSILGKLQFYRTVGELG